MKRRHQKQKTTQSTTQRSSVSSHSVTLPLVEHIRELRRRVVFIALSVIIWSAAAYAIEQRIVATLLRPAHGQSFIYTSPIDGINFLFKLCLYVGVALSIPVIVYQFLRFAEPVMQRTSMRFICYSTCISAVLALIGMLFGYFFGLPAALYFLLHQFVTNQIHPLLTIDAYLSFVLVYMLGSALVFQVPLIILFINRIKPLTPKGLIKQERWAILFAVVLGFIMNPTPNILDQLFVVGPIILSYQLSILMIWWQNHTPKEFARLQAMRAADAKVQAERMHRRASLQPLMQSVAANTPMSIAPYAQRAQSIRTARAVLPSRPRPYADGFVASQRSPFVTS